jgi:hypothetical protein
MSVSDDALNAAVDSVAQGETFTFVGFAVDAKGRGAVRFTNDKRRAKTLIRCGCTDVVFIELPQPMTKAEIEASEFIAQVQPAATSAKAV